MLIIAILASVTNINVPPLHVVGCSGSCARSVVFAFSSHYVAVIPQDFYHAVRYGTSNAVLTQDRLASSRSPPRSLVLYIVAFLRLLLNALRQQEVGLIARLCTTLDSLAAASFSLLGRFVELATEFVCATLQFA